MTATLGYLAAGTWALAAGAAFLPRRRAWIADAIAMLGIFAAAALIGILWVNLGRPPMRTLGETRWWYAACVPTIGLLVGWRFGTRVLVIPSLLMGSMFALINLQHPEYMDKTLMPALQSPWFVPHVVVYMVAYSALGLSSAVAGWNFIKGWIARKPIDETDTDVPHRLVMIGLPLLTCGLLFGALWAKEAWGHYWTWDPKETWAFLTWLAYLIYLHLHQRKQAQPKVVLGSLIVGFAVLIACWFGVNYMPTARESVHTYTQS